MKIVNKHVFGELYGCSKEILEDEEYLKRLVRQAVKVSNAKLLDLKSWKVRGPKGGVSVIALVLESHIAIHTWPEYQYATLDVYTCGKHTDPKKGFMFIVHNLKPQHYTINEVDRSYREGH